MRIKKPMYRILSLAGYIYTATLVVLALSGACPSLAASDSAAQAEKNTNSDLRFRIADPAALEFPKKPRSDLSVHIGGGKGVIIAPHWVMTASHCISTRRQGVVPVRYVDDKGKKRTVMSDKVIKAGVVDISLVRLVKPAHGREPILLLKDGLPVMKKNADPYFLKKVSGNNVWTDIPARVSRRSRGERFYVSKPHRRGKAGSSGSPWVIHSPMVGDVLVGVTHGTGRIPQVGKISHWILKTVSELSDDTLTWATREQALADDDYTGDPLSPAAP